MPAATTADAVTAACHVMAMWSVHIGTPKLARRLEACGFSQQQAETAAEAIADTLGEATADLSPGGSYRYRRRWNMCAREAVR